MGIGPKRGNHPRGWASAPSTLQLRSKGKEMACSIYKLQPDMSHPPPDRWLGGNCMVGVRRKEVSPQTSPKYLLQCGSHISLHYLLRITTHPRTFSQSHQLMVVSHCPAPIWPRNNQHTIRKLQPSIPHPPPDRWPRWKISGQSL